MSVQQTNALKEIAASIDRLARALEKLGMNDAIGSGPGCLETIIMDGLKVRIHKDD